MTGTTRTIQDRISELGVTIETEPTEPDSPEDWQHYTWTVTLRRANGAELVTPWHQGSALPDAPDAAAVLDCLASDAAGIVNSPDFEDWADEYGYDSDSRAAERIWRMAATQTDALRVFLGEHFDAVVFDTENL